MYNLLNPTLYKHVGVDQFESDEIMFFSQFKENTVDFFFFFFFVEGVSFKNENEKEWTFFK